LITWELDPLDSHAAALSFHRLGATASGWVDRPPAIDIAGQAELRMEVDWWLKSTRVPARADGMRAALSLAHYLEAGAQQVNPAGLNDSGLPTPSTDVEPLTRPLVLLEVPADLRGLARENAGLAKAWRDQVRSILEGAVAQGYLLTDFLTLERETFPRAFHVLVAGNSKLG
jgi:predicted GNAT superfamily acetyltransferase